jgi:hypothetical protein
MKKEFSRICIPKNGLHCKLLGGGLKEEGGGE